MTIDPTQKTKRAVARKLMKEINLVLHREWAPIPEAPDDEYESYVGQIATMLVKGAPDADILAFLEEVEAERMGFGSFDHQRGEKVVAALRTII